MVFNQWWLKPTHIICSHLLSITDVGEVSAQNPKDNKGVFTPESPDKDLNPDSCFCYTEYIWSDRFLRFHIATVPATFSNNFM